MLRVADYVFERLKALGVDAVFTLTGGGIMYLVDALGKSGISYVCCHHEQACGIAAQAYGMYDDQLGVCLVTTGPGGTNALTAAAAAFMDSTPMLFLSGQVKREDFASLRGVRQFGAQENDIVSMAKPVTKYAVTVMEGREIRYELEKALHAALSGRKGPVWLDIPLDVQSEMVEEAFLRPFLPPEKVLLGKMKEERQGGAGFGKPVDVGEEAGAAILNVAENHGVTRNAAEGAVLFLKELARAKRPLILLGHGAAISKKEKLLHTLVSKLQIPVLATWRALSVFDSEDPLFFGSPGLQAPRYSNLILQSCDLLLVLGSRLDNMITAFNEEHFAFRAKKVLVDLDEKELVKLKVTDAVSVVSDCGEFLEAFEEQLLEGRVSLHRPSQKNVSKRETKMEIPSFSHWVSRCVSCKERFPLEKEVQAKRAGVDLYRATLALSNDCEGEDAIVISSTSRCNTAGHMAFRHKAGQRTISSMGMGSMGFALPSAVGAWFAAKRGRIIVIEGDGSFQLNLQELQTIVHYNIPVKMFIFNNQGYAAITTMQERNFAGDYVGSNEKSGVTMPELSKIADAYGLPYFRIDRNEEIAAAIGRTLEVPGPALCDIKGDLSFDEIPKCISHVNEEGRRVSAALENPFPFLQQEELDDVMKMLLGNEEETRS